MATRIAQLYFEINAQTAQLPQASTQLHQLAEAAKAPTASVGALSAAMASVATTSATTSSKAGQSADQMASKFGRASFAIASTVEGIARTGQTSGEALKKLIQQGSNAAFFFGPQGAFVGALGVTALAVIGLFTRARDQVRQLAEETKDAIAEITRNIEERRVSGDQSSLIEQFRLAEIKLTKARRDLADANATLLPKDERLAELRRLTSVGAAIYQAAEDKNTKLLRERRAELEKLIPLLEAEAEAAKRAALAVESPAQPRTIPIRVTASDPNAIRYSAERLREVNAALDAFRDRVSKGQVELARMSQDAMQKLADLSGDTVRLLELQIGELTRRVQEAAKAAGLSPEETARQVEIITAPLRAAREAAVQLSSAVTHLAPLPPTIQQSVEALRKKLVEAGASAKEIANATTRAAVRALTDEYVRQGFALEDATRRAEQQVGAVNGVADATRSVADSIALVGNALISVLGTLGAIDEKTQSIARGAVNIGAGIANFSKNPLQGGVQILGGLADLAKGLFGQDPEVERRHREALQVLEGIRKNTGDLLGRSVSGNQFIRAQTAVGIAAGIEGGPRDARFFGTLMNELARVGISFTEVRDVAKEFGITLDGSRQSWQDFKKILDDTDLKALRDTFDGMTEAAALGRKITGNETPLAQLFDQARIFSRFSPEFATVFEGLNLGQAEDRAQALERIAAIWARIMAGDESIQFGDLTLQQFLGGLGDFSDLIRDLTPEIDDLGGSFGELGEKASKLDALREALAQLAQELELLDITDPVEIGRRIRETVQSFVPAIASALAGIDTSTLAGVDAADSRIRDLFARRAGLTSQERGGLTVDEFTQALLELDRALDAARDHLTNAAQQAQEEADRLERDRLASLSEAERAAEAERAQRVRDRLQRARNESDFLDETTTQAAQRLARALAELSPAFATLAEGLDLTTAEGIFAFNERLSELFARFQDGSIAITELGDLSFPEFLQALLDLEGGTDAATDALNKLLAGAETFADRVNAAVRELSFELELENITDPLERALRTVAKLGAVDVRIADALKGLDLTSVSGRAAADLVLQALARGSTDDTLRQSVLQILNALRAVPAPEVPEAVTELATQLKPGQAETVTATALLTAVGGDRVLQYLAEIAANTAGLLARVLAQSGPVFPPALPVGLLAGGAGGGGTALVVNVNFYGDVTTSDTSQFTQRLAADLVPVLDRKLGERFRGEIRANGSADALVK